MKILIIVVFAAATLSGCAIVPAYGPPGFYAPTIVVPFGGYYRGGHGHGHGHGHRGYR